MNTREIIAKVRRIEIRTRKIVDDLTSGAYHSVFKGRGMEFSEVREYQAGDEVREIDWNVTARFGRPFIKRFVEERELTVLLVVDISGSGDFGSGTLSKNQQAAELAALLAFSAIRNNDRVGLLLFSSAPELFLPPRKGRRHVLRLVRELLVHERRDRGTNIAAALERTMQVTPRRAVVFLISDMLDRTCRRLVRVTAGKHDLIVMRVTDPRELSLPRSGYLNVEDAESGATLWFPGRSAQALQDYAVEASTEHLELANWFRRAGIDLIEVPVGGDYVRALMEFFHRRERRR